MSHPTRGLRSIRHRKYYQSRRSLEIVSLRSTSLVIHDADMRLVDLSYEVPIRVWMSRLTQYYIEIQRPRVILTPLHGGLDTKLHWHFSVHGEDFLL